MEAGSDLYSARNGAVFGAVGGLISGIAFTGIMLGLSLVFNMPTGTFLHALGSMVVGQVSDFSAVRLAGFGLTLVQCVAIGIVFGIVTSKTRVLYPKCKRNGAALGLAAGIIAFLVIYTPVVLGAYADSLKKTLDNYPPVALSIAGRQNYALTVQPIGGGEYATKMEGFGLIAYLAYGFMMGGIVTLSYSILHFGIESQAAGVKEKGVKG